MKKDNRRKFLKKSILGFSGVALVPGAIKSLPLVSEPNILPPDLPSRLLGRTGIRTPLISMGTSGALDPGFIKAAYEAGVKLFFSATYYGEGNNEKIVGGALKNLPRDTFVIGTACPPDGMDNRTGTFPKGFDAEAYIKKAEGSLKRFGLDYVDIFLFPYAGKKEVVQNEGLLKVLEQLKKQGKTRFVGIASHDGMEEALKSAADAKVYDVAMPAYNFKTANRESMNAAIAYAAKAGIGIIAMKTIAGASRKKSGPPLNSDAALKWVLHNENISSVVSGMSTLEQLQKNLSMIENLKMTDQEQKDLDIAGLKSEIGLYCQQCRQCLPQCPDNLDIPAMMRSYMYAYGYKNMEQAWYTMSNVELKDKPCENCVTCSVNCREGFDIKQRITDIVRLKGFPKDFLVL
jgi:predicted aldo/keto reductase-like oxidoreductase